MELPVSLREAIAHEIHGLSGRDLGASSRQLSRHYRGGGTSRLVDGAAYLTSRLPGTYAATSDALAEARARCTGPGPASLLDVGSGPGTAAWAALGLFPTLVSITLLDASPAMLDLARRLAARSPWEALRNAAFDERDLTSPGDVPPADLVVAAYAMGELAGPHLSQAADRLIGAARRLLVVVEPGTPAGFRRILGIRGRALARGWHVVAPCPHEDACPLASDDWCHFPARYQRTAGERRARGGTRPFADEKYAYVALVPGGIVSGGERVIGRPRRQRGHLEVRLCTPGGLREADASRRDGELYRRLREARWGSWLPPS